ncbi:MAG: Septum formation initiator [Frankiales bacterium]|jgi:cell division protein FtsB|nr:Septum formation initiator [Frankiales bacterium]
MADSADGKAPRSAGTRPSGGASARGHLTSRAAILAIVMCAIALSLAYPVREYIAQRREIAALRHQERVAEQQVEQLALRKQRLGDESYIKREARRRLHYCMPDEKCYVVLDGSVVPGRPGGQAASSRTPPWYETLWRSVQAADRH